MLDPFNHFYMQFGNLSGSQVNAQSSATYTFYELPGEPWVRVRPLGEANPRYWSAVLASQSKVRTRLMKGKISAEMLAQYRKTDREFIPKYADGGEWGGWIDDATGEEVPYSPEAFAELCQQLPNDLFDELRSFMGDLNNFRLEQGPDQHEIDETVGN